MLNDVDALREALRESREYTFSLVSHLDPSQWEVPRWEIVNPLRWEVGHIGFFQEFFCLRWRPDDPSGSRTPSCRADADALYDSRTIAHDSRWSLPLPGIPAIRAYLDETLDKTLAALQATAANERDRFRLALLHEDMHGEAILMTLQSVGLPSPAGLSPPGGAGAPLQDIAVEGGTFLQGTPRGAAHYVFDNEKWAHEVTVAPFAIASRPVTHGEFADFVDDGGYARRDWWTEAGWRWRAAADAIAPRHWRRDGSGWARRWFGQWQAIPRASTMVHVNRHEAEAWCRWAGRRLPTEAEWEFAATGGGRGHHPWGDCEGAPPAFTPGGVWEWTATPFGPYPGFEPDAYEEYSQPYFGTHGVLRGGSFVTRPRLAHARWRNFYVPHRNDPFAGLRTCAISR